MIMTTRYLSSLLILFSTAMAFAPMPKSKSTSRRSLLVVHGSRFDEAGHHISFNPMEGYQPVNEKRARECAEHFGECSVEEMQYLRDNLHKERLQNFMFGGEGNMPKPQALEHRMLEEDLDLQLHLLKEQEHAVHNPNLFPDVEPAMQELPHLKNHNVKKDHNVMKDTEQLVHKLEHDMVLADPVMEESNLEAIALCVTLAAIWYLPQLMDLLSNVQLGNAGVEGALR